MHERNTDHEMWIRRLPEEAIEARTFVPFGNKEIKAPKTFATILRQSKKSKEQFYRVLRGQTGLAHKLQATARYASLFRVKLLSLA